MLTMFCSIFFSLTSSALVTQPAHAPLVAQQSCSPLLTRPVPSAVRSAVLASASSPTPTAAEADDDLKFPQEATALVQAQRGLTFAAKAVPIVASYLRLFLTLRFREQVLKECLDEEECEVMWQEEHERGSTTFAAVVKELKGFYTKTGQIIATRQDLFPKQYTDRLAGLTDLVDPMPVSLVKAVIEQELLHDDESFESVFAEFDPEPLGAASVAQVHRAVLTPAYGGGEVAVKVQRPAIEAKLLGDVAALKALAKSVRGIEAIPVDYYTVFSELEVQLGDEFDFVKEAAAMERIGRTLSNDPVTGSPVTPVVVTPRPVGGLVTKRVLVMDFLQGVPLSRAVEAMEKRGIDPGSPEAQLFGRRLLAALTEAFGITILFGGFFHADPHPGNIFVLDDGRIGLIDFGQVKQIGQRASATLAKVMVALSERTSDTDPVQLDEISRLALELGVRLREGAPREGPAATAIWLFDGSVKTLPGGFDTNELSPDSPVKVLKSFPQELTLVGRSTVLIKGIAARLNVTWSLADEWAPIARALLARQAAGKLAPLGAPPRFMSIMRLLGQWAGAKLSALVLMLPPPLRRVVASAALRVSKLRPPPPRRRYREGYSGGGAIG